MFDHSDHYQITAAGWAYRTNSRGWINYLNPQTGLWHSQSEAIALICSPVPNSVAGVGTPSSAMPTNRIATVGGMSGCPF
jgi:hypothetical protein